MMLLDDIEHGPRQIVLQGEIDAILHVRLDDQRGKRRVVRVVGVGPVALVFREIFRFCRLADIVEKSADAGEQRVGADGIGGIFRQLGR